MYKKFAFVLTLVAAFKYTFATVTGTLQYPTPPKDNFDIFDNQSSPLCTSRRTGRNVTLRNGIKDTVRRWSQFNVQIDSNFDSRDRKAINNAMWTLQQVVPCVKFGIWSPETQPHGDYVHIITGSKIGCSSKIGRMGGKQIMKLQSPGCMKLGTIMHEIFHALGFDHEQSRPDRDDHVNIQWANIKRGKGKNFEKLSGVHYSTFGVAYNTLSIMHYDAHDFSKNGKPTIIAKNGGKVGAGRILQDSDR